MTIHNTDPVSSHYSRPFINCLIERDNNDAFSCRSLFSPTWVCIFLRSGTCSNDYHVIIPSPLNLMACLSEALLLCVQEKRMPSVPDWNIMAPFESALVMECL
jgi:hypothetical protein